MATRSTIALEFADGSVQQVYCHWDGYLDHNGKILYHHYSNPFILRDLIDLGDVSSLRPMIGTKHPFSKLDATISDAEFDNLYGNMTTFYGRDRGESDVSARSFKDIGDYFVNAQREEYDYILRNVEGNPTWYVRFYSAGYHWIPLTEAFELEKVAA
jgi:hypothetical protein